MKWAATEVNEQYALRLKSGMILFDKYSPQDEGSSAASYGFKVLNAQGKLTDKFDIEYDDSYYHEVEGLFTLVDRQWNHADELIDEMIGEILSSDPFGESGNLPYK